MATDSSANNTRVLAVEDDPTLSKLLEATLSKEKFEVKLVQDGETALAEVGDFKPDVILLDLVLPGLDGVETCRQMRDITDAYIVMVTVKDEEVDKIVGLSVGADDYITKPFSPRELVARIKAMMRRPRKGSVESQVRTVSDIEIDPLAHTVTVSGEKIDLTKLEFNLINTLASKPNVTLTREDLLKQVWGSEWAGDDHVVDVHIANLRNKLGDSGRKSQYIHTVRGIGYRVDT